MGAIKISKGESEGKKLADDPVWLFEIREPHALLVVTHPDDETIFAGGLILSSRQTKWTIICCVAESVQRQNEFRCACKFLAGESGNRISSILLNIPKKLDGKIDYKALTRELRAFAKGYNIVFTHNSQGEYGHPNHKLVHQGVIESIANPNTWLFISPGSKNQQVIKSKKIGGNYTLDLSKDIQNLKIKAFQECHVSQAQLYGYDNTDKLRPSQLLETLLWEFESGKEQYTFYG